MPKPKINFQFREKLDKIIGGDHHNYCYQCGSCVAVCPAARYSPRFNPRDILLKTLLGDAEELLQNGSVIWLCTNCYSCYERCPQDVRPVEVIIALKNLTTQDGTLPEAVDKFAETVARTGRSAPILRSVNERRKQLGLNELKEVPLEELQKILE